MKSYKELLVILVLEARHSYCDKKLKVESKSKQQQNTNDCEKYLTAMSSVGKG